MIKEYLGHIICVFKHHDITEEEQDTLTIDKQNFRCRRCFYPVQAWISFEDSLNGNGNEYYWIQEAP